MIVVVATAQEYQIARQRFAGSKIIKTGVGAINVFKTLSKIERNTPILNFGYCGSNKIKIGTEVQIGEVRLYHPSVKYNEKKFKLKGDIPCYTSCDFVSGTGIKEPCVFDMELAFILAMGFNNVSSIKIVSDNLSIKEYTGTVGGRSDHRLEIMEKEKGGYKND